MKNVKRPHFYGIKTRGGSMRPLFKSGEPVLVERTGTIYPGDCVVYTINDELFLHRVWNKKKEFVLVKDDTALFDSHLVSIKSVLGKVINKKIFSKGIIGLFYGMFCRQVYIIGRFIKKIVKPIPLKIMAQVP